MRSLLASIAAAALLMGGLRLAHDEPATRWQPLKLRLGPAAA